MRILVTGAAGFIGSHMCEALSKEGHTVIGIDTVTDYYSPLQKELNVKNITSKGVIFVKKDLAVDDISDLISNAGIIFHFAAQPGISASIPFDLYERNNVIATYKLLEAIKNISTLKLFVNISTSSVYGKYAIGNEESTPKPASYYGVTKLAAEQLALSYFYSEGLPVTSLRLFSVYGERERPEKLYPKLISSVLEGKEIFIFEGSEKHIRSYTYVGDIIAGLLLAINNIDKCIGQIFNLGNDKAITTGEGISIVENIIGKKALIKHIPKRIGEQMETRADIEKIKQILGYNPQTLPIDGLGKEIEWLKEGMKQGIKF